MYRVCLTWSSTLYGQYLLLMICKHIRYKNHQHRTQEKKFRKKKLNFSTKTKNVAYQKQKKLKSKSPDIM